jgi:hypothetical protein
VKLLALAVLLAACATPQCYPKVKLDHNGTKLTGGGYVGLRCATKGFL